jgi:hypothetical protein
MELVVAGDLLHHLAVGRLEQYEVAQIVEQQLRREETAHYLFELEFQQRPVVLVLHRAPGKEALAAGRQRTDARMQSVGNHQCLVADEEVGDLFLVSLQLVVGGPDVCLRVGRVLQFDHRDGQAVDEADQIGPARLLATLNGELIDDHEAVALRVLEVDHLHPVAALLAGDFHLHRHPGDQGFVEGAVGENQRGVVGLGELPGHLVEDGFGGVRVEAVQSGTQMVGQQHLAVVGAFGRVAVGRDVRAVEVVPAGVLEPGEADFLKLLFVQHFSCFPGSRPSRS